MINNINQIIISIMIIVSVSVYVYISNIFKIIHREVLKYQEEIENED